MVFPVTSQAAASPWLCQASCLERPSPLRVLDQHETFYNLAHLEFMGIIVLILLFVALWESNEGQFEREITLTTSKVALLSQVSRSACPVHLVCPRSHGSSHRCQISLPET